MRPNLDRGDLGGGARILRRVLPWVALVIVLWITLVAYTDYRTALRVKDAGGSAEETTSPEATGTPDATGTAPAGDAESAAPAQGTVVVLADGLNMRTSPSTTASVIKRLDADVKLQLLSTTEGWYQVRDADGYEGWVSAGADYTRLEQ